MLLRAAHSLRRLAPRPAASLSTVAPAEEPKVEVEVDGVKVQVRASAVVMEACEAAGREVARFCYHSRLGIAGNCRMCLVEVEKTPKPVASCAMPVMANMKVKTNSPMAKKAREGVMEFLLANHPLDCPVCDQGGECDLQDQSMVYGSDRSRFREPAGKRAVEDKDFGPLIKTSMNRCIHCTRCVRFATEIAGASELGSSGRGGDMEIGTYLEKTINSELSGNVIDLCPVGALTSKPYAFVGRPWELRKTMSVDVFDALGSNIRVDARGNEVLRILPRLNEEINEEWLADKARFAYDGLKRQRLLTPMMRKGNDFVECSWEAVFEKIGERMARTAGASIAGVAGPMADAEAMLALKDLLNRLGSNNLFFQGDSGVPLYGTDFRANYIMNEGIAGVEKSDYVLLVGTNPRHEAPLLNSRLRKSYIYLNSNIGLVGNAVDLTYDYAHLGTSVEALEALASGKDQSEFAKGWRQAKRPMVIVGSEVGRQTGASSDQEKRRVFQALDKLRASTPQLLQQDQEGQVTWNGYSLLHLHASRVAALDLGFVPSPTSSPVSSSSVVFLLGADDFDPAQISKDAFVIYQGHHGDQGASLADVILPGAAYTEKSGTYVNTEGRAQRTRPAVNPPANSREDWKIVRALSEVLGFALPYSSLKELRARMEQVAPHLVADDEWERPSPSLAKLAAEALAKHAAAAPSSPSSSPTSASSSSASSAFALPIKDYYLTDSISRASQTMAKCSAAFSARRRDSPADQNYASA